MVASTSLGRTAMATARLLAQAELLAEIQDEARDAVLPVVGRLTVLCLRGRSGSLDPDQIDDLASFYADADLVTQVLASGAADAVQRAAQAQAAAALAQAPDLPPDQRREAIEAAGALARASRLARALQAPGYEERVRRHAARLREQLGGHRAIAAPAHTAVRAAAQARAAAVALAKRRSHLRPAHLVQRRARQLRAAELAERLVASARRPGESGAPLATPTDPALIAWLRCLIRDQRLYDPVAEHVAAQAWIGADLFGHRRPPPPPDFLAGRATYGLPAELVAPFLRRLSLTGPTPTAADLTVESLARDKASVSVAERDAAGRAWAGDLTGPVPLPVVTEIPRIVHGIWLGRPLPEGSAFWRNYADLADHYRGRLDVVIWTDLERGNLDSPAARSMVDWARAHGIHLVNVAEVFNAAAPMQLAIPYALEMGRCVPGGFAAASDHLRVEVAYRFGGLYADGDLAFAPEGIPELLDRVAASPWGFTLNALDQRAVWNDLIAAPAGHPALALWREIARLNYLRSVIALCGGQVTTPQPRSHHNSAWTWVLTPARSGRMHHYMVRQLRVPIEELVPVRPTIHGGSELTWVPPAGGEPAVLHPEGADVLPVLQRGVAYLRWQLLARLGDLHLTGVDPMIRGLPEPDVGWGALLTALPELTRDVRPVTSVTTTRRYDNGVMHEVALPPETRRLIRSSDRPWIGTGHDQGRGHLWLLDEMVVPAGLAGQSDDRAPR